MSAWTQDQLDDLRNSYAAEQVELDQLALRLGRDKSNVCRKARSLGLTNRNRPKSDAVKNSVSICTRRYLATHGHPRGALGMRHTPEAIERISMAARIAAQRTSPEQKRAQVEMQMRTKVARGNAIPPRGGTSWKAGWREIGGRRKYYRSRWEANYARYLQWLVDRGQLSSWAHEPKTFWFEGVKRGAVSYLPDFHVVENDGAESYHEVKGWMDARSKTKIKRMAKYHPEVNLVVIDSKAYQSLAVKVSRLVEGWE